MSEELTVSAEDKLHYVNENLKLALIYKRKVGICVGVNVVGYASSVQMANKISTKYDRQTHPSFK